MTLGEKIRIARTKKKMSQQELSEKAGTQRILPKL
jgi:transcriptional regulator with XRE-family HTH domain